MFRWIISILANIPISRLQCAAAGRSYTGQNSDCYFTRYPSRNRKTSVSLSKVPLKGVPTRKGKDRDEWPMAMCAEGGDGADVRYISPKDNRGAGSWVASGQVKDKEHWIFAVNQSLYKLKSNTLLD
ncbi:Sporulation-specific extracellular nuclease precursor [compost metagenome]